MQQQQSNPVGSMDQQTTNNFSDQYQNSQMQQCPSNSTFQQQSFNPISSMPDNFSNQYSQQQFQNQNTQQQFSNSNFQQHTSNPIQSMPPNLSNQYFQQQFQNSQQQNSFSPIQSMPKQNPNNNIPLPENPAFVPQSEAERPFHGFPIIYDDYTF